MTRFGFERPRPMSGKIDFSDFVQEPWRSLLALVKETIEKRLADGDYGETPEREYPLHDLEDDLGMAEWIMSAAFPPDGRDNRKKG